jgi:RNA polymerase sigma factor (sigma-70 family)
MSSETRIRNVRDCLNKDGGRHERRVGEDDMRKGVHAGVLREIGRLFDSGTIASLSDSDLLDRFATSRDEVAFAALVDRHGPMVLGVCRKIVRDPHEAEDVFQAAFLILARKAGSIRVDDSLGRWLYTIARRLATRVKAGRASRERPSIKHRPASLPADDPERREVAAIIHDELARLPAVYRNVILLCCLDGLTHEEAARRLQWPLGSVKGRLVRARSLLKTRLTRRGLAFSSGVFAAALRPSPISASLLERTLTAAISFVAGRAGMIPAATLANGVLTSMLLSKLKFGATALLALGVATYATVASGEGPTDDAKSKVGGPTLPNAEKAGNMDRPAVDSLRKLGEQVDRFREELRRNDHELTRLRDLQNRHLSEAELAVFQTGRIKMRQSELLEILAQLDEGQRLLSNIDEVVSKIDRAPSTPRPEKPEPLPQMVRKVNPPAMPKYVVGPTDVLRINVLEALPGRPISAEFRVRPDGHVSLGLKQA